MFMCYGCCSVIRELTTWKIKAVKITGLINMDSLCLSSFVYWLFVFFFCLILLCSVMYHMQFDYWCPFWSMRCGLICRHTVPLQDAVNSLIAAHLGYPFCLLFCKIRCFAFVVNDQVAKAAQPFPLILL